MIGSVVGIYMYIIVEVFFLLLRYAILIVSVLWLTYFGGKSIFLIEQLLYMTTCRRAVHRLSRALGSLLCRTTYKKKKKRFRTIEFNHEHTLAFIYIYYFKLYYKRSYTRSFSDAQNLLTGNVHSDRNETMKIPWPPCIKIHNVAVEDISTL